MTVAVPGPRACPRPGSQLWIWQGGHHLSIPALTMISTKAHCERSAGGGGGGGWKNQVALVSTTILENTRCWTWRQRLLFTGTGTCIVASLRSLLFTPALVQKFTARDLQRMGGVKEPGSHGRVTLTVHYPGYYGRLPDGNALKLSQTATCRLDPCKVRDLETGSVDVLAGRLWARGKALTANPNQKHSQTI